MIINQPLVHNSVLVTNTSTAYTSTLASKTQSIPCCKARHSHSLLVLRALLEQLSISAFDVLHCCTTLQHAGCHIPPGLRVRWGTFPVPQMHCYSFVWQTVGGGAKVDPWAQLREALRNTFRQTSDWQPDCGGLIFLVWDCATKNGKNSTTVSQLLIIPPW